MRARDAARRSCARAHPAIAPAAQGGGVPGPPVANRLDDQPVRGRFLYFAAKVPDHQPGTWHRPVRLARAPKPPSQKAHGALWQARCGCSAPGRAAAGRQGDRPGRITVRWASLRAKVGTPLPGHGCEVAELPGVLQTSWFLQAELHGFCKQNNQAPHPGKCLSRSPAK